MFGNTPTFLPVHPHPFCQDESKISVCSTFSRQSVSLRVFRENLTRVSDGFLANREHRAGSALAGDGALRLGCACGRGAAGFPFWAAGLAPSHLLLCPGPGLSSGVPPWASTWKVYGTQCIPPGDRRPLEPGSGDSTLPPVPPASSHPGAQISTLEFFTG